MSVMNISLPGDLREFIEAQVVEEGYESIDEYVSAVIMEVRKRKAMQDLVAKLDEAVASGPAEPMTPEDWEAIEREAVEGLRGTRET